MFSLILAQADTPAMSLYMAEVSHRHPDEHILTFLDCAGWHRAKTLVVPLNLIRDWLSPHSPQCNPKDLAWREVRHQPFGNHDHRSMRAAEQALERRLQQLEAAPERIRSLTDFDWNVNVVLNSRSY